MVHVYLEIIGLADVFGPPDALEQRSMVEHPSSIAHEMVQQVVLGGGQSDALSPAIDLTSAEVHAEVPAQERRLGPATDALRLRAAQDGPHPREQLHGTERLRDI